MSFALALLELMRPRQWVKNAFVLVGLLFGHAAADPALRAAALLATVAFCLASSAVYAFNDARDAEHDRGHPDKRARPVARGAVSTGEALLLGVLCAGMALALSAVVSGALTAVISTYLVLSVAYTLALKRVPVVDVVVIAAGFMLRLLAGTLGIGIEPSAWLLACGFLLTLFLGFAKRRAELVRLAEDAGQHRKVLDAYSIVFLDRATLACAIAMSAVYALYTLSSETERLHGGGLVLTLPWVVLGTSRYLYRMRYRGAGGDPTEELLRDPWLAAAAAGWLATVLWLIG
jgi:4-hydroxybenzoate polyprenyltransferase